MFPFDNSFLIPICVVFAGEFVCKRIAKNYAPNGVKLDDLSSEYITSRRLYSAANVFFNIGAVLVVVAVLSGFGISFSRMLGHK